MIISICIPTYNRAALLENCLSSIISSTRGSNIEFEVCISNNGSSDDTESVVSRARKHLNIVYEKQNYNIGIPRNFLRVVQLAKGDFVWLIGDDDLLLPGAIERLNSLFSRYPEVDFYFVNSFHLHTDYLQDYPKPFDTRNLPKTMDRFSSYAQEGVCEFFDLIDPKVSFDFLGGMFLSVFRRGMWLNNAHILDERLIGDERIFSNFDNTFPHVKIFARAFRTSKAYFNATPLNVCLTGAREWSPMYPLIHSIRLVEALESYKQNGLPLHKFLRCKNFALNNFASDFANMYLRRRTSGYNYVKWKEVLVSYCLYPNTYFSLIYFLSRKIKRCLLPSKDLK